MAKTRQEKSLQAEADMTIVMSAVAEYFGLSMAELRESNRGQAVVIPRQIAMYLAKQITSRSLQEIGQEFGGKHHATVMHSIAKIHELRRVDRNLDRAIRTMFDAVQRRLS